MARQYLTIPANSAPSERVFSRASDITTKKRNKLNKETFKMIILLKNWGIISDIEEKDEDEKDEESY